MTIEHATLVLSKYSLGGTFCGMKSKIELPFGIFGGGLQRESYTIDISIQVKLNGENRWIDLHNYAYINRATFELMSERAFRQRVESCVREIIMHEVDESFKYGDEFVNPPHPPEPERFHPKSKRT